MQAFLRTVIASLEDESSVCVRSRLQLESLAWPQKQKGKDKKCLANADAHQKLLFPDVDVNWSLLSAVQIKRW